MQIVEQLQQAAATVSQLVGPAVVRIGRGGGRGGGVVVSPGHVLTNAHNVRGAQVTVTFPDGRVETATVAGADLDGDLAVLDVDTGDTTPPEWAPSAPPVGTPVFALGPSPGGTPTPRVTFGLVSAVDQAFRGPGGRRLGGSIEHTAPLARGSSGGPVVDAAGRLLGINTNRLGDGFYLALPASEELAGRVDLLARGEAPARPRLGIALAPGPAARQLRRAVGLPERDGALVRFVEDGSPAARAGLRQGDLIVAAGGREVAGADDLFEALDGVSPGESLHLRVLRGVEELEVAVSFISGGTPGPGPTGATAEQAGATGTA